MSTNNRVSLSEKQFQAQVVALANLFGWRIFHTFDSRRSEEGFPDLVLARTGVIVFVELKVGKNKPTMNQLAWLAVLGLCPGVIARCWYPEDWDEIEVVITGRQK